MSVLYSLKTLKYSFLFTLLITAFLRLLVFIFILLLLTLHFFEVLLNFPHHPLSVRLVKSSTLHTLVFRSLKDKRLLLLHHSEPFVLINNDILYLLFRVGCHPIVEMQLSVESPHAINVRWNLRIVLLLTTLQDSTVQLRKLWGNSIALATGFSLIKVIWVLEIWLRSIEIIVTVDQEFEMFLVIVTALFKDSEILEACLHSLGYLMNIDIII